MIFFIEAIRLSDEKEVNIWIDSKTPKTLSTFPLVFPTGAESDHSQSVVQSTSNAVIMVTLEHGKPRAKLSCPFGQYGRR
jgi:hypothetical protein